MLYGSGIETARGGKIIIAIDDRECTQHPSIAELLKLPTIVERLDSADYAFTDRAGSAIGIERSEINNLVQKLHSGELEEQLSRCVANYSTVILLIEGVYDSVGGYLATYKASSNGYFRVRTSPHLRYEAVQAVLTRFQELGIEVLHTANFDCSMDTIRTIYMQRNKAEEAHTLFRKIRATHIPTRISSNPAVPRLMALCPRLGEKVAVAMIYKYGSIWTILHSPDKELLALEGFGKGMLKNLKESLGREP